MGAEWGNGRGLITRELADSRIARRGPEQPLKLPRWFEFAANDLVARIAIAGIDGISLQHLSDPDEQRSARLVEALCDSVVHLLASPTAAGA